MASPLILKSAAGVIDIRSHFNIDAHSSVRGWIFVATV